MGKMGPHWYSIRGPEFLAAALFWKNSLFCSWYRWTEWGLVQEWRLLLTASRSRGMHLYSGHESLQQQPISKGCGHFHSPPSCWGWCLPASSPLCKYPWSSGMGNQQAWSLSTAHHTEWLWGADWGPSYGHGQAIWGSTVWWIEHVPGLPCWALSPAMWCLCHILSITSGSCSAICLRGLVPLLYCRVLMMQVWKIWSLSFTHS